ncbi:substrate-binding periplasmic protein [Catenovulum maritimum]|nr:transporter substrate-binding domain-containing protein [Catenovulum maritimum]
MIAIDEAKGVSVAERMLTYIYAKIDYKIDIVRMPAKRAERESRQGNLDGELLRVKDFAKHKPLLLRVPTPVSSIDIQAFSHRDSKVLIENINSLSNYTLAYTRGRKYADPFKNIAKQDHALTSIKSLMQFIHLRRADIAIVDRFTALVALKTLKINDVEAVGPILEKRYVYHFLHKKHEKLVGLLNEVLIEMQQSGELEQLKKILEAEYLASL